mmetsp:Transcript_10996/g.12997  ORF Transcript_10996/g.12997 Transcript_10996/m.12997 type:complete len:288 (+) Transcript_10996:12-875(+)
MLLMRHVCFIPVLVWQIAFLPAVSSVFRFADNLKEGDQTLLSDIAPSNPSDSSATDIWSRSDFLLTTFWKHSDGFASSPRDNNAVEVGDDGERAIFTYGEVTTMGVRQLADALFFDATTTPFSETKGAATAVFYDLGSGVGRLVSQMYLDRVVQRAIGVELSEERHRIAVDDWGRLTASSLVDGGDDEFDIDRRAVQFIQGDAAAVDLSDATHIYISSLCFPDSVLGIIQDTVLTIASSCTSRISVVAAMSELGELERAGWAKTVRHIQMTWGGGLVRIYTRPMQCH